MKTIKTGLAILLKNIGSVVSAEIMTNAGADLNTTTLLSSVFGDAIEKIIETIPTQYQKTISTEANQIIKSLVEDNLNRVFEIDSDITDKEKLYQDCTETIIKLINADSIKNIQDLVFLFYDALKANGVNVEFWNENDIQNIQIVTEQFIEGIKNAIDSTDSIRSIVTLNSIEDIYNEINELKIEFNKEKYYEYVFTRISCKNVFNAVVEYNKIFYNKDFEEIRFDFLSDIESDIGYYSTKDENQPLISLLNDAWEKGKKAEKNVIITADGGMGKSSSFYKAVCKINEEFIDDFYVNKFLTQKPIAIYIPCFKFEKTGLNNKRLTIYSSIRKTLNIKNNDVYTDEAFVNKFLNTLPNNRLIVFFDGYNELIEGVRSKFTNDLNELNRLDKMQIILSSRIIPNIAQKYTRSQMVGVSEDTIKKEISEGEFEEFSITMKNLMRFPMFLRLYINNKESSIKSISDLLNADRASTCKKMEENFADDDNQDLRNASVTIKSLMHTVIPQAFHYLYIKSNRSMIFDEETFIDSAKSIVKNLNNNAVRIVIELLKNYQIIEDVSDETRILYKYKHEHIRDFYIACYIYQIIKTSSDMREENNSEQILYELSQNDYAQTVLRFVSELCKHYDYMPRFIPTQRRWETPTYDNLETWKVLSNLSDKPNIIKFMLEIMKAAYYNYDYVDLSGMNFDEVDLSESNLNGVVLSHPKQEFDCTFDNTIISQKTFVSDGHDTAVYACYVKNNYCFSFSNTELIVSSVDGLETKAVFPYEDSFDGYFIKSHCRIDDKVFILHRKEKSDTEWISMISVWDLSIVYDSEHHPEFVKIDLPEISKLITDISATNRNVYLALSNGSIVNYKHSRGIKVVSNAMNKDLIFETKIIAISSNEIYQFYDNKIYVVRGNRRIPELVYILEDDEIFESMCYSQKAHILLLFVSKGNKKIIKQIGNNNIIDKKDTITLDNIDSKISFASTFDNIALASNDKGNIYLFELTNDTNNNRHFEFVKDGNLSMHKAAIRHIHFNKDRTTFITACVDRTVRLCNYSGDILFKLEGKNAGLRKIYFDNADSIIATSYDKGILCINKKENKYRCTQKLFSNGRIGWNWFVEKIADSIFAIGNDNGEVILFDVEAGYEIYKFNTNISNKIESLLYSKEKLYVCVGCKIIVLKVDKSNDGYSLQQTLEINFSANEKPLCLCQIDDTLYIGTQKNNQPYFYELDSCNKPVLIDDFSEYNGWCRDIKITKINGRKYVLTSAFSRKGQNKIKQISLVGNLDSRKLNIIYELYGHDDFVIRGDWTYDDEFDIIKIATVSNDGRVLMYLIKNSSLLNEEKSIQKELSAEYISDKLGGIVTDLKFIDSNTIIASCLDGGIYQINLSDTRPVLLFKNTYGLFANGLDFSDADIREEGLREMLESNNNYIE